MARSRDISKVLSSNSTLATDAEVAATYQTKATAGLTLITPTSIANTGGTASIGTNGTVSFSAASIVSLNDVFSSTYENYKILLNITSAATQDAIFMRLRVAGSDNSSNNYYWSLIYQNVSGGTTPSGANSNNLSSSFRVGYSSTNARSLIEVFSPFATSQTSFNAQNGNNNSDFALQGGNTSVTTSYTGFTLIFAGNTTGSVSVYGYNK
jgi:hypothetical protein